MKTVSLTRLIPLFPRFLKDPLKTYTWVVKNWAENLRVKAFGYEFYLITSPVYLKQILKDHQDSYRSGKEAVWELKDLLGDGLFTASDGEWEKQHKMLKPGFHGAILKSYTKSLHEQVGGLVQKLKENTHQKIDLERELKRLMLGIQLETQFVKTPANDLDEIIHCLEYCNQYVEIKNIVNRVAKRKIGLKDKKKKAKLDACIKHLDDFAYSSIDQALEGSKKAGVSLELMMEAYRTGEISKKTIRDDMVNLIFAGFDTVAEALFFTLFELAQKPDIQEKIYAESKPFGVEPEPSDLPRLKYTKQVVQEGIRKYPVAWMFPRIAKTEDVFDGFTIPPKAYVVISPFLTHRLPEYWDNAEEFDPNRFGKEYKPKHPFAFIPFGQGKRICLGNVLAMMQMQMILPMLIAHFKFKAKGGLDLKPLVILTSREKVPFQIEVRE